MKRSKRQKRLPRNSFVDTLIDYKNIVGENHVGTSAGYACVIKISGIDIFHYSEDDQHICYDHFAQAELALRLPHKFVFLDEKPNYSKQKEFIKYKLEKQNNPYLKELLQRQLLVFDEKEQSHTDRAAYLFIYGKTIAEIDTASDMFISKMPDTCCTRLDENEIKYVLRNILTFGHNSFQGDDFIKSISPSDFHVYSTGLKVSDKYVTSLVAHDFPSSVLNLFFANMFNYPDTLTTVDCAFINKETAKTTVSKSLDELNSRQVINNNSGDTIQDSGDYADLAQLLDSLNRGNEQLMTATIRIILSAPTIKALEEKKQYIISEFNGEGISLLTPQNEMLQEYTSLSKHSNTVYTAIPLQDTFAKQYPFFYQNHIDENGLYFGSTPAGGDVVWNQFLRNDIISSWDMLFIGVKGSGKSVSLKSMLQDILALGNRVMAIDVEGEYTPLAERFGGKVVKIGSYPVINPLEIRKAYADNDSEKSSNFASELSRIITFMYQYIPEITVQEAEELKSLLLVTYSKFDINAQTDISALTPTQFPIFKDLLNTLRSKLYTVYKGDGHDDNKYIQKLSQSKIAIYENLELYLKNLAEGMYSCIFNGYSSIDISKEDFIVFNVKELSDIGGRVYDAQLFNILSYMWQEICRNVANNERLKNPWDRRHVVAVIDEAHRLINSKNPQAIEFIEKLLRRTRKYDAALWFASQSILDFCPKGSTESLDKILTIFSLVQYRIILKQTFDSVEMLHSTFPQFTMSELHSTTNFKPGDMLMSFGGTRQKLTCHRTIFKEDLLYIGNSRDAEEIAKDEEECAV